MDEIDHIPAYAGAPARPPDGFDMLARLCPDGVLVSLDDRIVYTSPAADAMLGQGAAGGLV
jgi:hypothetical protein